MGAFGRRPLRLWRLVGLGGLLLALWCSPAPAGPENPDPAAAMAGEAPLTQADIDGYIYLLPRLAADRGQGSAAALEALRDSGLTRRRAAYVGAKITIAQALASGLLSTRQMVRDQVPPHLQPSTEEIGLVNKNLASLVKAQQAARLAAGQTAPTPPATPR